MKKIIFSENPKGETITAQAFVGESYEIQAIYKSIMRHKEKHNYKTYSSIPPVFSEIGYYGLAVEDDGFFSVIHSDTILKLILDKDINTIID